MSVIEPTGIGDGDIRDLFRERDFLKEELRRSRDWEKHFREKCKSSDNARTIHYDQAIHIAHEMFAAFSWDLDSICPSIQDVTKFLTGKKILSAEELAKCTEETE
jgi:hypothetical protein